MGLSTADMKNMSYGMILDMFAERTIDNKEAGAAESEVQEATQADFDRF